MTRRRASHRATYREGAAFGLLSWASVILVTLAGSVLTARIYGVDVIGEYALTVSTVAALRIFSTAKERPALVRELTILEPRHPRVTGLFCATLVFSAALTAIVGVLALVAVHILFSGPIDRPSLFLPAAVSVAGYVLIGNTAENINPVFNGFRAGRELFWIRLHEGLAFVVIAVPLGIAYGTVWGLVAGMIGSQASALVHRLISVRRFMRLAATRAVIRDGFQTLPGLIRFGLKITPGTLAHDASNESGTWILGSLGSITAVGVYSRANALGRQLVIVNTRIGEMLFPTLVERRAKQDGVGFARALIDSLRYATSALLLPAAVVGGAAHGAMSLFGPGFERGADALAIMLLVPPLAAFSQMQRLALFSLDRPWVASISGVLRFVATIAGGVLLISRLGATGAALAFALGLVVDVAFSTRIVLKRLATPLRDLWPLREWLALALAYAIGFATSRVLDSALPVLLGLVAGGVAGSLAYMAVLTVCGAINERDRERFRDVRRKLARRPGRDAPVPAAPGP